MKTAMQELIVHLEMLKSIVDMVEVDSLIEYATNSLEKEKEQIRTSYGQGRADSFSMPSRYASGTDYYNQTFNQNK
jgi:hypothetical protein